MQSRKLINIFYLRLILVIAVLGVTGSAPNLFAADESSPSEQACVQKAEENTRQALLKSTLLSEVAQRQDHEDQAAATTTSSTNTTTVANGSSGSSSNIGSGTASSVSPVSSFPVNTSSLSAGQTSVSNPTSASSPTSSAGKPNSSSLGNQNSLSGSPNLPGLPSTNNGSGISSNSDNSNLNLRSNGNGGSPANSAASSANSNNLNALAKPALDKNNSANAANTKKPKTSEDLFISTPQKKSPGLKILTNLKSTKPKSRNISNSVEPDAEMHKILLSLDGIYSEAGKWNLKQTIAHALNDGGMRSLSSNERQQKFWTYDDTYGGEVRISQEVDKQGNVTALKGIFRTNQSPVWKSFVYNRNTNSGRLETNNPLANRMLNNCRNCHEPNEYKLLKK